MPDKTAVDAVSAVLDDLAAGKTPVIREEPESEISAPVAEGDTSGTDAEASGEGTEDAEEAGESAGEASAEEGQGEGDNGEGAEPEVNPRRADGTFKSKEEIAAEKAELAKAKKPAEEPAKKPAEGEQKPPEQKAKDPVNDPIPENLKKETRERMTSLVGLVKDRDAVIERQQVLFDALADTGASPEEFGQMLGYMRAVHSDKPEDLEFAYNLLNGELRALAIKLGKPTAGVDLLAEHADLQNLVEGGTVTREVANELALARARTADAAARAKATTQNTDAQAQAVEAGRQAMNALGARLQKDDPNYEAKKALTLKALGNKLSTLPPSQWVSEFVAVYATVQVTPLSGSANAGPGPATAGGTKPQPLRTNKQPTGNGTKKPTSAVEAMDAALNAKFGV